MRLLVSPECNVLVDDLEVIPLSMAFCVKIVLQPKIIFDVVDFCHFSQVTIFKPGVENKNILLLRDKNFKLLPLKISLREKLRKVPIDVTVILDRKVSLFSLVLKELFDHLLCFIFGKQH